MGKLVSIYVLSLKVKEPIMTLREDLAVHTAGTTGLGIKSLRQVATPGQSAVDGMGPCHQIWPEPTLSPRSGLWEVNFREEEESCEMT